jgi:hypothetical protein
MKKKLCGFCFLEKNYVVFSFGTNEITFVKLNFFWHIFNILAAHSLRITALKRQIQNKNQQKSTKLKGIKRIKMTLKGNQRDSTPTV